MLFIEFMARYIAFLALCSVFLIGLTPLFAAIALENFGKWQFNLWLTLLTISGWGAWETCKPIVTLLVG